MAKTAGRDCVIKLGGTRIAGARVSTITRNSTTIDVSDADDGSVFAFLADTFADDSLEITLSGLEDGTALRDIAFTTNDADRHLSNLEFEFPATPLDEITGNFILTSYEISGEYRDATTFNATFVRNGAHTFTQGV